MTSDQRDASNEIRLLAHELGINRRSATHDEIAMLRTHFGWSILPRRISAYVLRKHGTHAEDNREWPRDTTPDEYLESLRQVVLDDRSGVYLEYSNEDEDWTAYFVGRVRRASRGSSSAGWIVVIFNADRSLWVTGFQPERAVEYVTDRDGFWIREPR